MPLRRACVLFVAALLLLAVPAAARAPAATVNWRGLVGSPRPAVDLGGRDIVVLRTPSLAQQLARVAGATETQERAWTSQASAAQQQVLATLAVAGVEVQPDYEYSRVLDGFSAVLDPRAVALLERDPNVAAVYPVRAAYPASVSSHVLSGKEFDSASGRRPISLPGVDGHGVTIALLDTGVDFSNKYLRGHMLPGNDVVSGDDDAHAVVDPQDSSQIETHGTELAGILAGLGGPAGLHGVAPGATILPIRVAGWQQTAAGTDAVYARSDQLIEGLELAVDPNQDGDAHDAVRVALDGVVEPYAGFVDDAEAQAVQGALTLGTVVIAPAGNDGDAGPVFGSVAGPAAAPDAVAVAATDARATLAGARVVVRVGLDVTYDRVQPLLGEVLPRRALTLDVATPGSLFDAKGDSVVAGRAAIVPAGDDPATAADAAAAAGATAVLLYGTRLPAGSLGVSENLNVPVAWIPAAIAQQLLAAQHAGRDVGVAIGRGRILTNGSAGFVAPFSSQGLAFDGRVKPDVAAPGVDIATTEPGTAADGSQLYGTVTGTSAAAANVAGAAALIAQLRPQLDATALRSLLVGYAGAGGAAATQSGAGVFRAGASAVGEIASDQTTLGFGVLGGPSWIGTRTLTLTNVSSRRLRLTVTMVTSSGETAPLHFGVAPKTLLLRPGASEPVEIAVNSTGTQKLPVALGEIDVSAVGSETLRIPWSLLLQPPLARLVAHAAFDRSSFAPSDTAPAILTLQLGAVSRAGSVQIAAVSRLAVLLYTASGRYLGTMAELRDLLPGSYAFGITGRGPTSSVLPPGDYELRVVARPTLSAHVPPGRAIVHFRIL
ncbi:MAG TPA: S8 family serine peptidase [Gaiellaceae bacterium]